MDANLKAFKSHRASAEQRGIPFRFTFAEWWSVWSPQWTRRHLDQLCMCRNGDTGGYELGNIYIASKSQNVQDWATHRAMAAAEQVHPTGPDMRAEGLGDLRARLEESELGALADAMVATQGNMTKAAYRLGITFRSARYIAQKNGMSKSDVLVYGLARHGQNVT